MNKKNSKGRSTTAKPVKKPSFDLAKKLNETSGSFVASIEALVRQALQEHLRATTADLAASVPVRRMPTGGGPLAGASAASGKKAKAGKKGSSRKAHKVTVSSFDDSELEAKVIAFLQSSPESRVEAITSGIKARPDAIRRVVTRLYEQKKLVRRGKTRGTKYSLAPND
jgi:SpoVK/Ycf46/Vps4 family AAA+-type ATPase